jgi:hypothetical protein
MPDRNGVAKACMLGWPAGGPTVSYPFKSVVSLWAPGAGCNRVWGSNKCAFPVCRSEEPSVSNSVMLPRLVDDPKRWLECAAQMRSLAAEITDSDGRVIAVRTAKDLDWFAEWIGLQRNGSRKHGDTFCNEKGRPKPPSLILRLRGSLN